MEAVQQEQDSDIALDLRNKIDIVKSCTKLHMNTHWKGNNLT